MPSCLLAAMVVFMTSSGWPRVVTSNRLRPAPSSRLLNLTGFFSSLAGAATVGTPVTVEDMAEAVLLAAREGVRPDRGGRAASVPGGGRGAVYMAVLLLGSAAAMAAELRG